MWHFYLTKEQEWILVSWNRYMQTHQWLYLGIFIAQECQQHMRVCPKHRDDYAIRWRTGKIKCCVPTEVAGHETTFNRGDRGMNRKQFYYIFQEIKSIISELNKEFPAIWLVERLLIWRFSITQQGWLKSAHARKSKETFSLLHFCECIVWTRGFQCCWIWELNLRRRIIV